VGFDTILTAIWDLDLRALGIYEHRDEPPYTMVSWGGSSVYVGLGIQKFLLFYFHFHSQVCITAGGHRDWVSV